MEKVFFCFSKKKFLVKKTILPVLEHTPPLLKTEKEKSVLLVHEPIKEKAQEKSCWNVDANDVAKVVPSLSKQTVAADVVSKKERKPKKLQKQHFVPLNKNVEKSPLPKQLNWANYTLPCSHDVMSFEKIMAEEKKANAINEPQVNSDISEKRILNWTQHTSSQQSCSDTQNMQPPFPLRSIIDTQAYECLMAKRLRVGRPLHLLEIEECAMAELEQYYMSLYGEDTPVFFVIRRDETSCLLSINNNNNNNNKCVISEFDCNKMTFTDASRNIDKIGQLRISKLNGNEIHPNEIRQPKKNVSFLMTDTHSFGRGGVFSSTTSTAWQGKPKI